MTGHLAFDHAAQHLGGLLPAGPRLVVIGSTSFWHAESEATCQWLGHFLAQIPQLLLITGGMSGVGETVGRSFLRARCALGEEARVYHVLPVGEKAWDYGVTLFAGEDMAQRREILGRLARVYLAVEGGPGTAHEAHVAASNHALVIPLGRSGGHSEVLYEKMRQPRRVTPLAWKILGSAQTSLETVARAAEAAVRSCV